MHCKIDSFYASVKVKDTNYARSPSVKSLYQHMEIFECQYSLLSWESWKPHFTIDAHEKLSQKLFLLVYNYNSHNRIAFKIVKLYYLYLYMFPTYLVGLLIFWVELFPKEKEAVHINAIAILTEILSIWCFYYFPLLKTCSLNIPHALLKKNLVLILL